MAADPPRPEEERERLSREMLAAAGAALGTPAELEIGEEGGAAEPPEPGNGPLPVELVEEERLRFGLGGLFLLMSFFSLQFAAIYHFGPAGALAGVLLLSAAFLGVAVWAEGNRLWRRGTGSFGLETRLGKWFPLLLVATLAASVVLGVGQVALQEGWRYWQRRQVAQRLGFTYTESRQWLNPNPTDPWDFYRWHVEVTGVTAGGAFDLAGIESGEVIVDPGDPDVAFAHLDLLPGQSCELGVVRPMLTQPLGTQPVRRVTVVAPP